MANPTLVTNRSPIHSLEQQTSVFAASATLATAGFTIPATAHEIHCYPSAACSYRTNGTATAGLGSIRIAANQMFVILHHQQADFEIIGDAGAITLTVAYMK